MSRGTFGIAVANGTKGMSEHDWLNDTSKVKWTIDLDRDPPHVQILDNFPGGTKWTLDSTQNNSLVETLFAIKHGMPFKPKFLCYFYTKNAPSGFSGSIGQYTLNHAWMLTNAISIGEEGLYAEVDDTYFYIKHFVDTFAFGTGTNTFYGSDYKFRVRFMILNQPAYYTGGKGY